MRRRVWCETLSFEEVARPALATLLGRYQIDLLLAVRPWQLDDIGELVRRLQGAGVFVALWPMVADDDGRWASVASCARFVQLSDDLIERAPSADELVIDLEPPIALVTRWKRLRPTWGSGAPIGAYRAARDAYVDGVRRWSRGRRVTTALVPMLAAERGGQWMQRALGTPTTDLAVHCHSVMAYTSLFEGWSRGLISRRRAEALLLATAQLARRRFGERTGLSLGTVGTGAFGDEPCYRDVDELRRDVAIARAAGIDELALFDLGGVLRRGPAEAWLEALSER